MNDRPKRNTPAGEAPQGANFWTKCPEVRGACLVAASCVLFASAKWRKLTRSAAAPLPTKSNDFAGAPVGNTPQEWGRKPFRREWQRKAKWRKHMRENPYKRLPPIERKPDGTLCRMTPAQRKQANALIRRECCNYEDGNCMLLDNGDTHTCPQTISFSVCCKWFRWSVLPQIGTLEAEIFRDKELKRCAVCGGVFVPKSNRAKYCPDCAARVHRRQKTESERKRRSTVDS